MKRNLTWISLMLVGSLALAGCEARPSLVRAPSAETRPALLFTPTLAAPQGLQAIVNEFQASDIHRVELVPYLLTETYELVPVSRVTGEPTDADDPEILKAEMSGEALNLKRAIALSGLRPHRNYKVVANAYTLAGEPISDPELSGIWIDVKADDRPEVPSVIPIYLRAVPFYGRLPLDLQLTDPGEQAQRLEISVSRIRNGMPFKQGLPLSIPRDYLPSVVNLVNLAANVTYQVEVKARPADPAAPDLAVTVLEFHMENDDTPATRSIAVIVP